MNKRISITLSKDVLTKLDGLAGSKCSRSALIELVLREYLQESKRPASHAWDLARINDAAEQLNAEAEDVMEYQALP